MPRSCVIKNQQRVARRLWVVLPNGLKHALFILLRNSYLRFSILDTCGSYAEVVNYLYNKNYCQLGIMILPNPYLLIDALATLKSFIYFLFLQSLRENHQRRSCAVYLHSLARDTGAADEHFRRKSLERGVKLRNGFLHIIEKPHEMNRPTTRVKKPDGRRSAVRANPCRSEVQGRLLTPPTRGRGREGIECLPTKIKNTTDGTEIMLQFTESFCKLYTYRSPLKFLFPTASVGASSKTLLRRTYALSGMGRQSVLSRSNEGRWNEGKTFSLGEVFFTSP